MEDSVPQASLESVLCTEELHRRPWRSPDYEKENRALVALVSSLADSPHTVLETLAETILDITQSDSAGLSLLTKDGKTPDISGERFYWPAIAGVWNPHVGGGVPRNFSPCGDVLDQNRTLLFRHFERRYPYLLPAIPAAEECLLVPFYVDGRAVGTIWAIMHSDRRRFDREDDRVMASLGKFASSAYQALVRIEDLKSQVTEREKAEAELRELTDGLAEQAVRESEETFRSVFREAGVGMIIVSPEGRYLAANRTFCDYLGYTEEELLAKTVESITFSEDWPSFSQKLSEALREGHGFQWLQKRCLHKSGRLVYTESSTSLIRSRDGSPQYFVAEVLDVTSRKEAEEALSAMTRKLIESQEQERARIGRELHDDINQRIAMLAVELEQLQDHPSDVSSRVQVLRERTVELADDVQALSHDLHSSKLEYLGVVAGMKSWCKEFAERRKIEIDFRSHVSSVLPLAVGLSLFRVLQEALSNAIKHSGVKRIEVELREDSGKIHLVIRDLGRGFDVEAASAAKGLGLTSMRERVRLVKGTISIDSKPMGGTTIHVRVPLGSEHVAKQEAV